MGQRKSFVFYLRSPLRSFRLPFICTRTERKPERNRSIQVFDLAKNERKDRKERNFAFLFLSRRNQDHSFSGLALLSEKGDINADLTQVRGEAPQDTTEGARIARPAFFPADVIGDGVVQSC
jgi:hypothetical protein